jgi:uncharacterized protein (DUF1800 family)
MADDIGLMAHLMRRAGFGATRAELEERAAKGYDATVEELINPEEHGCERADEQLLIRFQPGALLPGGQPPMGNVNWMFHLVNTKRPLEEKITLFWHHVFATGNSKVDNYDQLLAQIAMFREKGMGNYTEVDVREASRAFTGWTLDVKIPRLPYGRHPWSFKYLPEDHDETEKTFLGHTGNFNGEDIIDIIVQQPACHRFIARHLYNFFVADEPQVPAWQIEAPRDPKAIDMLATSFKESGGEMKAVLRTLFTSDFFKNARYNKIKSPAELVVSTLRQVGGEDVPRPYYGDQIAMQPTYMGQDLLNPPSVEGWHTGSEWINSGSLMSRINFAADMFGDVSRPGVQDIIARLKAKGNMTPEQLVDACLDLMGPLEYGDDAKGELLEQANAGGDLDWSAADAEQRVAALLQLIVAMREYQFN